MRCAQPFQKEFVSGCYFLQVCVSETFHGKECYLTREYIFFLLALVYLNQLSANFERFDFVFTTKGKAGTCGF